MSVPKNRHGFPLVTAKDIPVVPRRSRKAFTNVKHRGEHYGSIGKSFATLREARAYAARLMNARDNKHQKAVIVRMPAAMSYGYPYSIHTKGGLTQRHLRRK